MDASYCQDWSNWDSSFHVLEIQSSLLTFRSAMLSFFDISSSSSFLCIYITFKYAMNFFKMVPTSQFSVKNAIVWDVTPCSVVEIHPCFGRTCYPECAVSRFLWNNEFLPGYPISHSRAVFSKVTVTIRAGHASHSWFLCSVSIKFLSELSNLYRMI